MKVRHLQNATSKLVAAAQGQNPRAQRLLFERYAPQMLGLCRSYLKQIALAEDALSQGFYKAFKHIGQLKKAALFESWLRRIMVNESLSLLRKNSGVTLEYELEGQLEFSVPADAPNHLAYADLQKFIDQLPNTTKAVFLMAVVEGYKHNEIAAQLNISVAASKTLLHRARKQLQQRITLNDHHYEKQPS